MQCHTNGNVQQADAALAFWDLWQQVHGEFTSQHFCSTTGELYLTLLQVYNSV